MQKIDREYNIKENYKSYLINNIQKSKMIIKRIEKPLIQNAIDNDLLEEKKLKEADFRAPIKPKKKTGILKRNNKSLNTNKDDKSKDKNSSESGYFLNKNNTLDENINLNENEQNSDINNLNPNKTLKKSILKNKSLKEEESEKKSSWKINPFLHVVNVAKNIFGIKKKKKKIYLR